MVTIKDLHDAMQESFTTVPELSGYQWRTTKFNQLNRVILDITSSNAKYFMIMSEIDDATGFDFDEGHIVKECFGAIPYKTEDLVVNCYNVNKDIVIRQPKYCLEYFLKRKLNFVSVGFFHDILFIGRKNAFLGIMFYNGSTIFYRPSLLKLLNFSKEKFTETLKLIAAKGTQVCDNLYLSCVKGPTEFMTDTVGSVILKKYNSDIVSAVKRSKSPEDYETKVNTILSKVRSEAYSVVAPLFNGCIFGASNMYSYAQLMKKMQKTYQDRMQEASLRAYEEGAIKSSVYAAHGFKPSIVNGRLFWKKPLALVPVSCVLKGRLYKMPEKNMRGKPLSQVYYISQLIVNPDGTLNAIGQHPNVGSGGRVCMGDMADEAYRVATMGADELDNFLSRAEKLLDVINYDSAYIPYDHEFKLEQFCDSGVTMTRYAQRKSSNIRNAVFVDDVVETINDDGLEERDDDDQQVVVTTNPPQNYDNMIQQNWTTVNTTIEPPNVETVPV